MMMNRPYTTGLRGKQEKISKKCPICKQHFLGYNDKIYCTLRCKAKQQDKREKKNSCLDCGKKISYRFKKCGKCTNYHTKTFHANIINLQKEGKSIKQIAWFFQCKVQVIYYCLNKYKKGRL